jgi:hypothetical protein
MPFILNENHAWITRDELVAVFKWMRRFDCPTVEEWNEFVPGNDEKPYAFVAELYEMRRPLKDLMIGRVLPEWKRVADYYSLDIEIRNYVTAGSAAASDQRFELIGRKVMSNGPSMFTIWELSGN